MSINQYGAMIEHILCKVKEIAEGQKGMEGKFSGLEERLDKIDSNIVDTRRFMYAVDETLYEHEQRFSVLGKKMGNKD